MANTLHSKNCFIILRVDDKTGEIIGVEDNTTRRNQQNIIDFLKSKKFAGDYRPTVELRTLTFGKHEIDDIVILDSSFTPFYLSIDYIDNSNKKTVRANAIYTRIGDTNTPIDKCADYSQIEYLWKKDLVLIKLHWKD